MKQFLDEIRRRQIEMLNARPERYSPGRIAFNIVQGVDNESDDFDFLSNEMQNRWEEAVTAAENHRKNNCTICGKPWLDHEFGVPAPECP